MSDPSVTFYNLGSVTTENLVKIVDERKKQREAWGDQHDDAMPWYHLPDLLAGRAGWLANPGRTPVPTETTRKAAIQLAALTLAYLDWIDRNDVSQPKAVQP